MNIPYIGDCISSISMLSLLSEFLASILCDFGPGRQTRDHKVSKRMYSSATFASNCGYKGIAHTKMKILSVITHPHVPNPKDLCLSSEHQLIYF